MNVTAALSWYAETPETLARCVSSLQDYCDRIVVFGGRWEGFPDMSGDDWHEQSKAIMDSATKAKMTLELLFQDVWESQVEKRSELMRRACMGSDWILVIDADEFISGGEPDTFRFRLKHADFDVARVFAYRVPLSYGRHIHRVYRSATGVSVERAHNCYVTADGRYLNGDPAWVKLEQHFDFSDKTITIAHDLSARGPLRKTARAEYNKYRRKRRIEAWS